MQKVSLLVVAGAFAVVSSLPSFTRGVLAQGTSRAGSGNPISQAIRQAWTTAQKNITASAELMPEATYDFKPVESVRTFGQILAHVAGANYEFCAASKGEKSPHAEDAFEKNLEGEQDFHFLPKPFSLKQLAEAVKDVMER